MNTTSEAPQSATTSIHPSTIAWLRLARIYLKIDRRTVESMRRHNLSVSRFDVLNHAGTPEGRTQQELAESLLVTKGNVTQLLDGMESDGLLERRRDGRAKRIYLTALGRVRRTELVALQEAEIAIDFAALDDGEVQHLIQLLRKIDRSLGVAAKEP
jgi:DNA-binding MarR family transcriptional regulator